MKKLFSIALASALLALGSANAAPITFTGTSGNLAASASFDVVGSDLVVTLSNIGGDALVPADLLTAVFFTLAGNPTLGSGSAILNTGSTVLFDPQGQPAGGVVGGEWAYLNGISGPNGANKGISSSGFGLFGGATFPGPDLDPPSAVAGFNYALLPAADNPATGNNQLTGNVPLVKSSVVFRLTGIDAAFDPSAPGAITNVSFQYGTSLSEPNVKADTPPPPTGNVPEPGMLALLGIGLAGLGVVRRRR
ncbi:XDD4 family exosortase-dependent surface protein [Noviherbaspirillum massiliense]|uniref:XDD4 family exosortase-dependent surface protein n=1 Tax=Noviherbaspirillum massiliense TaxID=1465823 RepID=UPI0002E6238F|nr:XDD4 family exosortase-dependent surface protein [Noviherbaspirillum massiliense]